MVLHAESCQTPLITFAKLNNKEIDASPLFLSKLPKKPYCCDDLQSGLKIRPRAAALRYKYIQFNHLVINYLIFDVDCPAAALAAENANVATPNLIVINKENQHAHLIYRLESGVSKFPDSSLKALRYLAAIETAYTLKLQADFGYAGLITKNPLNPFWTTWHIHDNLYDLAELADYVELEKVRTCTKQEVEIGVGRNVYIFDSGRYWAYEAVRTFRQDKTYQDFAKAVYSHLQSLNSLFQTPLPISEVISTAKSIAKWTWQHDKEAYRKFITRQTYKGRLGGLASGKSRALISNEKKQQAISLKNAGYSITGIARTLDITRQQVYSYFN